MNELTHLMVHGSFTKATQNFGASDILKWHVAPKDLFNNKNKPNGVLYKGRVFKSRMYLPPDMIDGIPIFKIHGNGWKIPGYSDVIERSGRLISLVSYNEDDHVDSWEITNGAHGWNGHTRHVCMMGGMSNDGKSFEDNYLPSQFTTLEAYVNTTIRHHNNIKLIGHNQVSLKDCPGFNVPLWGRKLGMDLHNLDFVNYGGNTRFKFLKNG